MYHDAGTTIPLVVLFIICFEKAFVVLMSPSHTGILSLLYCQLENQKAKLMGLSDVLDSTIHMFFLCHGLISSESAFDAFSWLQNCAFMFFKSCGAAILRFWVIVLFDHDCMVFSGIVSSVDIFSHKTHPSVPTKKNSKKYFFISF